MEGALNKLQTANDTTQRLAANAAGLRFEQLPENAVSVAKHCLLDWLGVTMAGAADPLVGILVDHVREEGGAPQATLIGHGGKVSASQAALVNGSAGHALDYDDVLKPLNGHPTAPVMPAVLALAEHRGADGKALLTAFVAGVETEARVGAGMGEGHYTRGYHATGTNGTFGAAAGCANLLGLDAETAARTLGIAGTQAAGLKSMFGTMCKPLHAGKAAMNGLYAATLAARGFTARPDVLDCVQGFADTQSDGFSAEAALEGLGSLFHIPTTRFKYHAACYGTHAPIDAARKIRGNPAFDRDAIDRVEVRVAPRNLAMCNIQNPGTGLEIKFSLRFTIALALAGEETGSLDVYSAEMAGRQDLVALRDRIRVQADEALGRNETEVIVHQTDGTVLRERADLGLPNPDLADQWRRLEAKFRALAVPLVGEQNTDRLVETVADMESCRDLGALAAACTWTRAKG